MTMQNTTPARAGASLPAQFLDLILPPSGVYAAIHFARSGDKVLADHDWCRSPAELAERVAYWSANGFDTYHACASYQVAGDRWSGRRQANVVAVKALWLDIDCGEGKPYADIHAAVVALANFLQRSGLPTPMVVQSGAGLHVYWSLAESMTPDQWRGAAKALQKLCEAHGLAVDPARTADHASVLRTPGTLNYKRGAAAPVRLLGEMVGPYANHLILSKLAGPSIPAAVGGGVDPGALSINGAASAIGTPPPCTAREVERIKSALACIPSDEYEVWVKAGMALHWTGWGDVAFKTWGEWSAKSEKYKPGEMEGKWASFGGRADGVTLGTLFALAKERGWADTPPPAAAPAVSFAAEDDPATPEIRALAALPLVDYERRRKEVAERLGLRASILDKLVAAERGGGEASGAGRALTLPSPEPWHEPVDGAELLNDVVAHFQRFAALPTGAAEALALWAVHTHCFEASPISPRLVLTSPEKRCGKTTVLRILAGLVPKPLPTGNITPAAVFRTIELVRPTLLVDEADSFARDNEELRGILNSGHARDGSVIRTVGDDHTPRQFSTWCPTVLAAIGRLADTIEDRAVIVPMRRRLPDERVERLRLDRPHGETLARRAARWAADHFASLADMDPNIPTQLHDRGADNWRPLFAIADKIGGDWPMKARHAALTLAGEAAGAEPSIRTQLLSDIRDAYRECGKDRLTTDELLGLLVSKRDRPWGDWSHGRAITAVKLARLLADFHVRPTTIRVGTVTAKGYLLDQFKDAFVRYLSS